jgi:hypothetical protein
LLDLLSARADTDTEFLRAVAKGGWFLPDYRRWTCCAPLISTWFHLPESAFGLPCSQLSQTFLPLGCIMAPKQHDSALQRAIRRELRDLERKAIREL